MKIWENIAACLFVLCFPLLLLSSNIRIEVSENRLYEYGFDKYNIAEATGLQKSDLMKGARGLIDYFNGSEESPQVQVTEGGKYVDLFNLREILHLRDVKSLIQLSCTVQWITLAYIMVYIISGFIMLGRGFLRQLMQVLVFGSVFTLGLLAFFGLWAAVDFNGLFRAFHWVSFSNDLYFLDPTEDYLMMMFPEGFFVDAALLLIGSTVAQALVLGGGAWIYRKEIALSQGRFLGSGIP